MIIKHQEFDYTSYLGASGTFYYYFEKTWLWLVFFDVRFSARDQNSKTAQNFP